MKKIFLSIISIIFVITFITSANPALARSNKAKKEIQRNQKTKVINKIQKSQKKSRYIKTKQINRKRAAQKQRKVEKRNSKTTSVLEYTLNISKNNSLYKETYVAGTNNAKIGSAVFQVNNEEGVNINTITINLEGGI